MSPDANRVRTPGDDKDRVRVFDTTLRDGEQAPGCTMNLDEKLQVAHQLARLGVDVIEAGYPAASPGDAESVKAVAEEVGGGHGPTICGLARATEHDVRTCARQTDRGSVHADAVEQVQDAEFLFDGGSTYRGRLETVAQRFVVQLHDRRLRRRRFEVPVEDQVIHDGPPQT